MGGLAFTITYRPFKSGMVQATIAEIPILCGVGQDQAEARLRVSQALREHLYASCGALDEPAVLEEGLESEKVTLVVSLLDRNDEDPTTTGSCKDPHAGPAPMVPGASRSPSCP